MRGDFASRARRYAALACLLVASCRCGAREGAPSAVAPDKDWLEGRLPASVNEGTPKRGGTLVVRLPAEPSSLDRLAGSDLLAAWMLERRVLESMAALDADRHPDYPLKPALAERWDVSPDGLVFTFHLRRGVLWHDGRPFGAADVVATVKKILDPAVRGARLRHHFRDLDEIVATDDFTVRAKFRTPHFLAFRALATMPVYPAHRLEEPGDFERHPIRRAPVGTGPFRFVEWTARDRVVFERWDRYWGRPAWLDRVICKFVEDAQVAFQLLQQGKFDLFVQLRPQQWVREMPGVPELVRGYNRVAWYDPNYMWIGWNTERPFFADARVRRALAMLLDREGMRQSFLLGIARPATCHFFAESAACDQTLKPLPYDEAAAAALLDEAGWKDRDGDGVRDKEGVPFRFAFNTSAGSAFLAQLAPYLQQQFKKAGIDVEIRRLEWALFNQHNREHRFDATSLVWSRTDVVEDPWSIWHSSQARDGANYISYRNDEVDRLIEQARTELDDARRNELYRRMGRVLHDDAPYTFLYSRPNLDAARRNVRGLRPAVTWYDLQDVWLADEAP